MRKAVIIGAGPAGLTAAYELLQQTDDIEVTILEESDKFGGISKTVKYKGNRMDMGGHRFFSKVPEVNEWWEAMMPQQGAPAKDDIMLDRAVKTTAGGPDPEKEDVVMLTRKRVSRIFFKKKFFDYPISLKPSTIMNMGLGTTIVVGFSYIASCIHKREEKSLEDFYINRFGKKLYSMFFENYTENLWGRHPSEIAPDWGSQRVKGLSIMAIIKDIFSKMIPRKNRKVETSLIEEFAYPKLGPGQLWEVTAEKIKEKGGKILTNCKVTGIMKNADNLIEAVEYVSTKDVDGSGRIEAITDDNGNVETKTLEGDIFISSMPLKDLVCGINDTPEEIHNIAAGLPYRDYVTLGVLVPRILLKNKTKMKTVSDIVPDCWVYVHDRNVQMGRFQIYNNWSPYLINDLENTVWLGLEYFCYEGDEMWNMNEEEFSRMAVDEMVTMGLIESPDDVIDTHLEHVKKAYPAYFDTYSEIDKVVEYINGIDNLYCVGRNGQHRYNNLDHSMCTSFETVRNIVSGSKDKSNIWNVNTEKEYHESK